MNARRRYNEARSKVRAFLDPIVEVLASTDALVVELEKQVVTAEATLEALRPVWAQGHSSDSIAAQANARALAELWKILGATNQTQACSRLNYLRGLLPPNVEWDGI